MAITSGWVLLLLGCGDKGAGDSGGAAPAVACFEACAADATEGVFVCSDGDDAADGTRDAPLATVSGAITRVRESGGAGTVYVDEGRYDDHLNLADDVGGGASDDGLAVIGCGSGRTTLAAGTEAPAVKVSGAKSVYLEGLTLEGGRRGLQVTRGAEVSVVDLVVAEAGRVGVLVDGQAGATSLDATDLYVLSPAPEGGALGYGVLVQHGASFTQVGGEVSGATAVGVLAAGLGSSVVLDAVDISETLPDADDAFGRGIMLQELSSGAVRSSGLFGNSDAGMFAVGALSVQIEGTEIHSTSEALLPGAGTEIGGDGIVVIRGDAAGSVTDFQVSVVDTVVADSSRAAAVFEDVELTGLSGISASGSGFAAETGESLFVQGEAVVSASSPDPYAALAADTLGFNELALDGLVVE